MDVFHLGQRKPQKVKTMHSPPQRDAPFRHIDQLKREFLEEGFPVLSMDTKKKETLGDYLRPGRVLSSAPLAGWDP